MEIMEILFYAVIAIVVLSVIVFIIWLIYSIIMAIYHTTLRYEITYVVATVCGKEYNNGLCMSIATKTYLPYLFEKYNVYLLYENEEYEFDDKDLYNEVEIEDTVQVIVYRGYNSKNECKHLDIDIDN
jgi:hypothetical protein